MARNRVKGITVEIGGDLTKLDKAFQGTNKYISDTTSKLKDVDRLLKFDPKNVELLDQKQRLLAQAVEGTAEKYENLDKVLKSSTVSNVKYAEWEKALASFQRQMTTAANEVSKWEKAAEDLEDLGFKPDSSAVKDMIDRADEAREKLEDLRQASIDTYNALGRPISIDQYDALQRELSESKMAADAAKDAFDNFSPAASKFASAADTISDKAGKIASATKGVSLAAGGLLAGMLGSVKGTEEFRSDLSKLETNARLAGLGLESTEKAMRQLNAVSDETDSSVEALSNLLQAGVTESNLQRAVENLAGAAISFPDTIKIESLADSLQETLATGSATGQFAEVLARLGVSVETFNAQLGQVPGEADKLNFALDTLQNQGLAGVYNAWTQNNEALIENKDANLEFQKSLADLAEKMQPLMTTITELATSFMGFFSSLDSGTRKAIVGLIALVAGISPVANAVSSVSGALEAVDRVSGIFSDVAGDKVYLTFLKWSAIILAVVTAVALLIAMINILLGKSDDMQSALGSMGSAAGNMSGNIGGGSGPGSPRQSAAPLAMSGDILDNYPHFASGGVFAPNNPMLGVLGDHKTEYEVAAPESVIESSVQKALLTSGLGGGQKTVVDVHFSGTLAPLIRQLHPLITAETTRLGPAMAPRR